MGISVARFSPAISSRARWAIYKGRQNQPGAITLNQAITGTIEGDNIAGYLGAKYRPAPQTREQNMAEAAIPTAAVRKAAYDAAIAAAPTEEEVAATRQAAK